MEKGLNLYVDGMISKRTDAIALVKDYGNPMKDDILIHHILKRLPSK